MKRITLLLSLLLICMTGLKAQPLNGRKWTSVVLPVDSLVPYTLFAFDSLRAFYSASASHQYFDDIQQKYMHYHTHHYFQTDDGGKTWVEKYKTGYGDTIGQLAGSSFFFFTWRDRITGHQADSLRNYFHYFSSNSGTSWKKQYITPAKDGIFPLATYSNNGLIAYSHDSGYLHRSTDYGQNYPTRLGKGIFHNTVRPSDTLSVELRDSLGISELSSEIRFAVKDPLHYTVLVIPSAPIPDTTFFPFGIVTLVTTNGGASWEKHVSPIPNNSKLNRLYGTLQYDNDKNILYYFVSLFGEGRLDGVSPNNSDPKNTTTNLPGEESLGFSYIYSTDDGRTWNFNEEFGLNRRAYEPVAAGEIWMTTTPNNIGIPGNGYQPAHYIKRTTDFGATWETDSITLGEFYEQKVDGRLITFSDPRHGWIVARSQEKTYILRYDANEQPLSVKDDNAETNSAMWLFPSPAKDEVNINFVKEGVIQDIEFFDIMGRKVTVPFAINGNSATATLRDIPSGYYMVRAKLSGQYYARPLIVGK
jgi:hypothetical protein